MPDISMCEGVKNGLQCPQRSECHRHTATPSPFRQTYFTQAPFTWELRDSENAFHCPYFWPMPAQPSSGNHAEK